MGVAPPEATDPRIGIDHRMTGHVGMRARVAGLRVAAADVAARRAQADVEAAAALLASIRLCCGDPFRRVLTRLRRAEGVSEDLHVRSVRRTA